MSQVPEFEVFWAVFSSEIDEPVNESVRLAAIAAWNKSLDVANGFLSPSDSQIRLMAGEMTAGELRTAKAVLGGCVSRVRQLHVSEETKLDGERSDG